VIAADYSRNQTMAVAQLNAIDVAYTTVGDPNAPSVLMIMGRSASHSAWHEDLTNGLASAAYQVVFI